MCGIVGYVGKQNPKALLIDGLRRMEYRGYDSAGVAFHEPQGLEVYRAEGRIDRLEEKIRDHEFSGRAAIGHTRWATHGAPIERNAHPHRVGRVVLAHNGIIENYAEHKANLLENGRTIQSDTDSEIVAHLIDFEMEQGKDILSAVREVLPRLRGAYAFVVLCADDPALVLGVRNGSPLLLGVGSDEHLFASDVQAILPVTKNVVYLEDGQVALCKDKGIEIQSVDGEQIEPDIKTIDWDAEEADKLGYPHYMLKEIHEQPQALANTLEGNIDHQKNLIDLASLREALPELGKIKKVNIIACGTSLHAALVGQFYIEQFARLPVSVDFASEFRYRNAVLEDDTLSIFISQSGETADTLAAVREVKSRGKSTLAIVNVRESTIDRESQWVVYTNAGPEIGVASTKAFTTQLAVLYMLAVELGRAKASLFEDQYQDLTSEVLKVPALVEKALGTEAKLQELAKKYHSYACFFYVGRGAYYPIALEGALKLKEISYLHAEGYPAGELKHGPIALITDNVVTLALAPRPTGDPPNSQKAKDVATMSQVYYEKLLANLEEVKARKGKVIAIGTEGDKELQAVATDFVGLPEAAWGLCPILLSVPVQLFSYYVAVERGTDVDKPRNLAKSVTVE